MQLLALVLACSPGIPQRHGPAADFSPGEQDTDGTIPSDDDSHDPGADSGDSGVEQGPCPTQMVLVSEAFCFDVYEAALEELQHGSWVATSPYLTVEGRQVRAVPAAAAVPQGYISGDEAEAACQAAGKRLCSSGEWLAACQGPQGWTWPYGDAHVEGACNDAYGGGHPVTDYFGTSDGVWDSEHMNHAGINQQPGTVAAGGAHPDCVSAWGAYDLHGNLHEWVSDASGTFRGGFYADASINGQGCTYATTAHDRGYHDYSTGFRCCAEPQARPQNSSSTPE